MPGERAVATPPQERRRAVSALVFGDQSDDKRTSIRRLVQASSSSPVARRWLEAATTRLQEELARPDRYEHSAGVERLKRESLLAFADVSQGEDAHGPISTAISCIGRLGELLIHVERDASVLGSAEEPVHLLAICTGLVPAAAVSVAHDLESLFRVSVDLISVMCGLSHEIWVRMQSIEPGRESSWSATFVGLGEEAVAGILDDFHERERMPRVKRIAVGVTSRQWITLFGAPSSLERLRQCNPIVNAAARIEIPVNGCVHNPYFPSIDLDKLLDEAPQALVQMSVDLDRVVMPSTASRLPYRHVRMRGLLKEIMQDIVTNKIALTELVQSFAARLDAGREIRVIPMGPSHVISTLASALSSRASAVRVETLESHQDGRDGDFHDEIAIVGMAGRFPGSDTLEGFWRDLHDGTCHIKPVPSYRFDVQKHYDPTLTAKNATAATYGAWLENAHMFDNKLFNISAREARQMDPIHRLLMLVSYEALQSSGYTPGGTPSTEGSRIATYFGQLSEDWHDLIHQEGADIYYAPGIARAFAPSRLNFHYKWGGGSYAVDSACASSQTALILACKALRSGEIDMAVAGGGSLLLTPVPFSGLSRSGMLSSTGGCRAFHDDADGYARGEGVGVFVLKRVRDALADNDNILGLVTGEARKFSTTASSMTHPSSVSQMQLYQHVLQQHAQDPLDFAYVEMHGTGTQAGDYEEMTSVLGVFAKGRGRDNPLTVGTIKAAIGHSEAAAGSMALAKVLLMLRHNQIPPQPGWPFPVNKRFAGELEPVNARIATQAWPLRSQSQSKSGRKIKILVNGFDASGGESCLTVSEPPPSRVRGQDPRSCHVVAISAKTSTSLELNHHRLIDFLTENPTTELSYLAYTTTARRIHEPLRIAYKTTSTTDLLAQLEARVTQLASSPTRGRSRPPKCVFLFTGQGSQYHRMGVELYNTHAGYRNLLQRYDQTVQALDLPSFIDVVALPTKDISEYSTTVVQLAIVALEIAMASMLKEWGILPSVVVGHSLGEYAALHCAGVLSTSDVFYMVGQRAVLMEEHLVPGSHTMLATKLDPKTLVRVIKDLGLHSCGLACKNGPQASVVSGEAAEIKMLEQDLLAANQWATLLHVAYGFHSPQIEPILEKLEALSTQIKLAEPTIPLVSTLTGNVECRSESFSNSYFARQAREAVNFYRALQNLQVSGLVDESTLWVELGATPVLLGLTELSLKVPRSCLLPTMRPNESNWSTVSGLLKAGYEAGLDIKWARFHKYHVDCLRLLDLPTYSFDCQNFELVWREPVSDALEHRPEVQSAAFPSPLFRPTTSLQRLDRLEIGKGQATAEFSSSLSEPNMLSAIQGHVVDGITICPMSIIVDMALTAVHHLYQSYHSKPDCPPMSICDIDMHGAVVLHPGSAPPEMYISAVYRSETEDAIVTLFSTPNGEKNKHGTCRVTLGDSKPAPGCQPSMWASSSQTLLYHTRMESLRTQATAGRAHRLLKSVVYSLFEQTVMYGTLYQGMEEVIIDAQCRDAVADIKLPSTLHSGVFAHNPYWIDALTHLGGFVLNSGLKFSKQFLCMALGFDYWRSRGATLSPGQQFTAFACIRESEGTTIVVDSFIFHEGELCQELIGLRFQKMKRTTFQSIFGPIHQNQSAPNPAQTTATLTRLRVSDAATKTSSSVLPNETEKILGKPQGWRLGETQVERLPKAVSTPTSSVAIPHKEPFDALLDIVAQETGAKLADMNDDTLFADLGLDSLLAISIIAALKKERDVQLPVSFFMKHDSVAAARAFLTADDKAASMPASLPVPLEPKLTSKSHLAPDSGRGSITPGSWTDETDSSEIFAASTGSSRSSEVQTSDSEASVAVVTNAAHSKVSSASKSAASPPTARSTRTLYPGRLVTIQRARKSTTSHNLFLVADDSGSSLSYVHLGFLGANISAFGVELHLEKGAEYDADCAVLVDSLAALVIAKQPQGPYLLGGIGAGAILALEIARKLLAEKQLVAGLLLMDPGVPAGIDQPSKATGDRKQLLQMCLMGYSLKRLSECKPEKTIAILPLSDATRPPSWNQIGLEAEERHEDFESGMQASFVKMNNRLRLLKGVVADLAALC